MNTQSPILDDASIEAARLASMPASADEVARATIGGIGPLFMRTVAMRFIGFAGSTLLARWLAPDAFGIFFLCNFIVQSLNIVSDAGLTAVLVQQAGHPDSDEQQLVFTVQGLLTFALVALLVTTAPWLSNHYALHGEGPWLLGALSLSMFVTWLGAIPAAMLDRKLLYGKRAVADLLQQLVYYAVTLPLAALGFGVWSLVFGTLAAATATTVALFSFQPWRPAFAFSADKLRPLLRFGLPIQGQACLAIAEVAFIPIFLGKLAGPTVLGYLTWSYNLSLIPLQTLSSIYGRMALPSLSRLQDEPAQFAAKLDRATSSIAFIAFPVSALIGGVAATAVPLVFGAKWTPAVPLLYWLLASNAISAVSGPYHTAFVALGRPGTALKLKMVSLSVQWISGILISTLFGYFGYVVATVPIALAIAAYIIASLRRIIPVNPAPAFIAPTICAALTLLAVRTAAPVSETSWVRLIAVAAVGTATCGAAILAGVRIGFIRHDPFRLAMQVIGRKQGKLV